jgi:hypothetical protein
MTKEKTVGKKKKFKEIIPQKQFTIFYNIGADPNFFIVHGTRYIIATLDIKSPNTSETCSFPVIHVIDEELKTMDIIPLNSVANIRHNWIDK